MNITPQQARRELERRRRLSETGNMSNITPSQASEELEKRRKLKDEETSIGRGLARGAKNVLAGAAGVLDLPTMPIRYGLNKASEALGSDMRFRPAKDIVNETIDEMTGGYTKSKNKSESLRENIAQELVGLPVGYGLASKMAKYSPKAMEIVKQMYEPNVSNIGGTTGAIAASEHYRRTNEEPSVLGELVSGMAGGVGGSLGATALKGSAQAAKNLLTSPREMGRRFLGKTFEFNPELYERAREAGIPISAGMVSEGILPTAYENILHHTPGSSPIMSRFYENRNKALVSKLGLGDTELSEIPRNINKDLAHLGAEGFHKKKSSEYEDLHKIFGSSEKKAKKTRQMVDIADLLENLREKGAGLTTPSEKREFSRTVSGKALSKLESLSGSKNKGNEVVEMLRRKNYPEELIDKVKEASNPINQEISYGSLDLMRSQMLKKMESLPHGSSARKEASDIYNALAEKRHTFMEKYGSPEEIEASKRARQIWREYVQPDIEKSSGKEIGLKKHIFDIKNSKSEAAAFDKLLGKDHRYLQAVSRGLDQDKKSELFHSLVAHMGLSDNEFKLSTFFNKYNKKEPGFKNELLNLLPNNLARKNFNEVVDFLGENKRIQNIVANTSKTAHSAALIDMAKEALKHGSSLVTGAPIAAIEGLVGLLMRVKAGKWGAQALTDPVFLDNINKAMRSSNPEAQSNFLRLVLKRPSVKDMMGSTSFRSLKDLSNHEDQKKPLNVRVTNPTRFE